MAKTERLYIRIDPETKALANALFDNMDITLTDAVTLFLQQSLKSGGFPFDVESCSKSDNKYAISSPVK